MGHALFNDLLNLASTAFYRENDQRRAQLCKSHRIAALGRVVSDTKADILSNLNFSIGVAQRVSDTTSQ